MNYLFFIIGTASYWFGTLKDAWASKDFEVTGGFEGSKWVSRADGDFSMSKYMLLNGGLFAILVGLFFVILHNAPDSNMAGAMFLMVAFVLGAFHWNAARKNKKRIGERRIEQLQKLKDVLNYSPQIRQNPNGVWQGILFSFFTSKQTDYAAAWAEINAKVKRLAREDESVWFDRAVIDRINGE